MKIETKFGVGDVAYVCRNDSTYEKEPCKICEGKSIITFKEESFCCTKCYGSGFTRTKRVDKFIPEKRTIKKVIVTQSINSGNLQIYTRYETKPDGYKRIAEHENIMFATKEEAEERCRKLNQEAEDSANGNR